MRLTKVQIEDLSRVILKRLKGMDMVTVNAPDDKLLHRITEIMTADLMVEDKVDIEVRKILEAHEKDLKVGGADYMKMFQTVKDKLVKEKNLII